MFRSTVAVGLMLALSLAVGCKKEETSGGGGGAATDLSTPKAAAKTFFQALLRGDSAGARAAAVVADDKQGKTIDAMAAVMSAMGQFQDAAKAKFGDAAKAAPEMSGAKDVAKIDKATEKIDGDNATLTAEGDPEPMKLKKVGGSWKVDVSSIKTGPDPDKAVQMMTAMAKAASEVAGEIKAGKYAKFDDAMKAMQTKMMSGMPGMPEMPH